MAYRSGSASFLGAGTRNVKSALFQGTDHGFGLLSCLPLQKVHPAQGANGGRCTGRQASQLCAGRAQSTCFRVRAAADRPRHMLGQ